MTHAGRVQPFVVVAADVPDKYRGLLEDGKLQPVKLVFLVRSMNAGGSQLIEMDVRDLWPEEIIAVVNRALAEGRIEFGFRRKGTGGLVQLGGGM